MTRAFALLWLSCGLMPAVAQDLPDAITVPEETMQKLVIHKVKPLVQAEGEMRIQGTVVLDAIISKGGSIESLQMVSGHPMLVPAALGAVKQWRYRPYEVNGIPRAVETTIRVEFLNEEAERAAPEKESPILANADDMRGRLIYRVAPIYPPLRATSEDSGRGASQDHHQQTGRGSGYASGSRTSDALSRGGGCG